MRRILVVEDDEDLREAIVELLRLDDHEVVGARDGVAALRLIEAFAPDLALIDVGLPGMSGAEVADVVRRRYGTATRIVATTGFANLDGATRSRFDHVLLKPLRVQELDEQIALTRPPDVEPPRARARRAVAVGAPEE